MQTTLNNVISRIIDYRGKTPLKLGYNWVNNGKYIALSAKNVKTGKLVNLESAYHDIYSTVFCQYLRFTSAMAFLQRAACIRNCI